MLDIHPLPSINAGQNFIFSFQLENGEEECQIKRLVLSAAGHSNQTVEWGLFQEPGPVSADFTSETNIMAFAYASQAIVDRTTTIRVPRGWTLGVKITNQGTAAADGLICTLLHYKVLS